MPETPTLAFALLFSIIIMYAAYLGIETFARSAEILFPMFIFIFIFSSLVLALKLHLRIFSHC